MHPFIEVGGILFAGFGGSGGVFTKIFNAITGWIWGGPDAPGKGFDFLSDAEYGVKFGDGGTSGSPPMTGGEGPTPQATGSGLLKAVDQVNLPCNLQDSGTIAVIPEILPVPYDGISWKKVNTITGEETQLPSHKVTTGHDYTTVDAKQEGSYIVYATGTLQGKTVSGCDGSIPVVVSKPLMRNSNSPQNTGPFNGVPTAVNGYAYQSPGENRDRVQLKDMTYKNDSSYAGKTAYFLTALSEIKYNGIDYFMVITMNLDKMVMYIKQSELSRVLWPAPDRPDDSVTTDYWGWRSKPSNRKITEFHYGVDVGTQAQSGLPAVAMLDGTLVYVERAKERGYTVMLKHSIAGIGEFYTLYQHLSATGLPSVAGINTKKYKAGEQIAIISGSGSTSESNYDIHLHYEIMRTPPARNTEGMISYSYHSINPLRIYADRDTRDPRPANAPVYNPEPFFVQSPIQEDNNKYVFNSRFDWNFDEPVRKNKQPVISSHYKDYGIIVAGGWQDFDPGEE